MRKAPVGVFVIAVVSLLGCGKYGRPLPPEAFSPAAVKELAVTPAADSLSFSWRAPTEDMRSKDLRSIEGYRVLRALVDDSGATKFEEAKFIADTHLSERERLRAEARAQGKPVARLKEDPALSSFSFVDTRVTPGSTYAYRIVPVNQGGTPGAPSESIRVVFNGVASQVTRIPAADLESEIFDGSLAGGEL